MYLVTENKWVLVNSDSGILSLLTHLRDTIAARSSIAQKPVDYEIGAEDNILPSTHETAAEDSCYTAHMRQQPRTSCNPAHMKACTVKQPFSLQVINPTPLR